MPIGHELYTKKYPKETELAKKLGNRYNPDCLGRFPWETSITLSPGPLGKFITKIHVLGGAIGNTFMLSAPESENTARYYDVFFIFWLKPSCLEKLKLVMGKREIKPAACPTVSK